jgi:hypothetical protein
MSASDVAAEAVRGIEAERFMILPHAEVRGYLHNKTDDFDRWNRGMARLQRQFGPPTRIVSIGFGTCTRPLNFPDGYYAQSRRDDDRQEQ